MQKDLLRGDDMEIRRRLRLARALWFGQSAGRVRISGMVAHGDLGRGEGGQRR